MRAEVKNSNDFAELVSFIVMFRTIPLCPSAGGSGGVEMTLKIRDLLRSGQGQHGAEYEDPVTYPKHQERAWTDAGRLSDDGRDGGGRHMLPDEDNTDVGLDGRAYCANKLRSSAGENRVKDNWYTCLAKP